MSLLSQEQIQQFRDDGYICPITVLSKEEKKIMNIGKKVKTSVNMAFVAQMLRFVLCNFVEIQVQHESLGVHSLLMETS